LQITERRQHTAEPVDLNDATSAWLTGRPDAVRAVRKVRGKAAYQGRHGTNTGGANAVYWLEILQRRGEDQVFVRNITEGAKRQVEKVQTELESDLIYPLLHARDAAKWHSHPSASILLTHEQGNRLKAIPEQEME